MASSAPPLPPTIEGSSSYNHTNESCLLKDGTVVDECYKSRFYAWALEFYLLRRDQKSSDYCRCLMENCPQRNFTSPHDMLWHLKECEFFSEGLFRCPTCACVEKFRTTSRKGCSWTRPKFSQRLRDRLRATVDTVRGIASSSVSGLRCEECGRSMGLNTCDVPKAQGPGGEPSELPIELQGSNGYPYPGHSPVSNQPTELSSDVSPTSSTEPSVSASGDHIQLRVPPAGHYQRTEGIRSTPDMQTSPYLGDFVGQMHNSWQPSPSTLGYGTLSTYNSAPLETFGQAGVLGGRTQSLTIQTSHTHPSLGHPGWGDMTFYTEGTLDTLNIVESPTPADQPRPVSPVSPVSTLSPSKMPSLPNIASYIDPLTHVEQVGISQTTMPVDSSPQLTSETPSSGYDNIDLSDEYRCPYQDCTYAPTGKEENFKSYQRKHMLTHNNDQRYKCEHCGKLYTRQDNREVHIRKAHQSPGDCKRRRGSTDSLRLGDPRGKRVSIAGKSRGTKSLS
ncbi:hypothetical protein F5Y04DRAFT_290601 [Hypomontagnella monticulosa]|nr:hypothetical protein F5Y04DRAFT_290601 [Hypomontagnella monticulosa]